MSKTLFQIEENPQRCLFERSFLRKHVILYRLIKGLNHTYTVDPTKICNVSNPEVVFINFRYKPLPLVLKLKIIH